MQVYICRFTKSQWDGFDDAQKGRVTHDFNPGRLPGQFVGLRTLRAGGRRMVEGLDFVVEGNPRPTSDSLV